MRSCVIKTLARFVHFDSAVYRQKLMLQRPTVVRWSQHLLNSVSFIGSVDRPLKLMNTNYGSFGAQTYLKVVNPDHSQFRIRLAMWNELGTMCMKYLKPDDFIFVSGRLQSYTKLYHNGNIRLYYSVHVKELNYVAQCSLHPSGKNSEILQSRGGEAGMVNYEDNKLYLWQVFFTSPYEWRDNRKTKTNPKQPDFKHKDTKEALWLMPNDPPWVRRQLDLLDSRMENQGLREKTGRRSRLSMWEFDE